MKIWDDGYDINLDILFGESYLKTLKDYDDEIVKQSANQFDLMHTKVLDVIESFIETKKRETQST